MDVCVVVCWTVWSRCSDLALYSTVHLWPLDSQVRSARRQNRSRRPSGQLIRAYASSGSHLRISGTRQGPVVLFLVGHIRRVAVAPAGSCGIFQEKRLPGENPPRCRHCRYLYAAVHLVVLRPILFMANHLDGGLVHNSGRRPVMSSSVLGPEF